uniref:hypothetical protein n=1 Tax=Streptococcus suis TaxID=1307 RepID=UPI001EDDFAB0
LSVKVDVLLVQVWLQKSKLNSIEFPDITIICQTTKIVTLCPWTESFSVSIHKMHRNALSLPDFML